MLSEDAIKEFQNLIGVKDKAINGIPVREVLDLTEPQTLCEECGREVKNV